MLIKFKLQEENPTVPGYSELQVTEYSSNQYRNLIEENKDKYLFKLNKIKNYNLIPADQTSKILTIQTNFDFQLNIAIPWQINLEVPVKELKALNNNTYLFATGGALTNQGLKDYEKIKLITEQRINEKEIVRFTIPDLRVVLAQDKEDRILRLGQAYHSLTKIQPNSEITLDDPREEVIQKFLVKYHNDYQTRIKEGQKNLQKLSILLKQFPPAQAQTLSQPQNDLSRQLEVFTNPHKFQKKLTILKEKYHGSHQLDQLQQELKKIEQEFLDFYTCLQGDGWLDYSGLEQLIQKIKTQLVNLNNLGYRAEEIVPGGEYEEWNQAQIKKNEATEAIRLDPPLTETQKKKIKSSQTADNLISNIMGIQRERHLSQAKTYFKNFIRQELKKTPVVELHELGDLRNYEQAINELNKYIELRTYTEKITTKIKKIRSPKIVAIEELKAQSKKNISETLTNFKLKADELHPQHQNWLTELEKMENKSQILQFEQDLTLLLSEINCLLGQKLFPNLDPSEKVQIKQVKDSEELTKQSQKLQNENEQNYFLQRKIIFEIRYLFANISPLNKEQNELLQKVSSLLDKLSCLSRIKLAQQVFNEFSANSLKKKAEQLQELQKIFAELSAQEELSESEKSSQAEVKTKLDLSKQGKMVGKLAVLNERQVDLSLLDLSPEAPTENEVQTGNDFGPFSQQTLTLLAIGGFLLIFLWRWYRKKREEDPF
ncbi:14020_t:CDS:2 [Funneliformis geosporum]|uniref:14020_t:CDS:1 n=1 Tax=Funneliformis geosporum TaxID=1117311 RepID=A0A9W4WZV0_9GLOM|nr:14020_t:CDS:2 [Funneliformis geosporum]